MPSQRLAKDQRETSKIQALTAGLDWKFGQIGHKQTDVKTDSLSRYRD